MSIKIGNAPCSWGVEFANDPRNPSWQSVLDQCRDAGFNGIELGPIGFLPEDTSELGDALSSRNLDLIGTTFFQPFHDPSSWQQLKDQAVRSCKSLKAHGAKHFVLIDSISERRAKTAGRASEAEQMSAQEFRDFIERIRTICKMGAEEYGLTMSIHPHAGGFLDFRPETEDLLNEIDESLMGICLDTGHAHYAGFDLEDFMNQHMDRIVYMHFKDINPTVKQSVIKNRTGFYDACGQGIFCKLGDGEVDFEWVKKKLSDSNFSGWCTIEQDCDPTLANTSPLDDAIANRQFLESIGFQA